jgi:6-pyruvoyltetrahydropterin/6-carboxytetrahydropterin synthase
MTSAASRCTNANVFRLTREVRFAINDAPDNDPPGGKLSDGQLQHPPANSYAGYPSLTGLGRYLVLRVTMAGELDPQSQYIINIKQIDELVRDQLVEVQQMFDSGRPTPRRVLVFLYHAIERALPGQPSELTLATSPLQTYTIHRREFPMMRLSTRFEFSASHRLHNPAMSDEENRNCFGKCNNPHGHGHNYELQVTLTGTPDNNGVLIAVPAFERIVKEIVIDRFDHKNLNEELPEFQNVIPSVENIAKTIYGMLKPALTIADAKLASVTVWETAKTWCEYEE